MSRPRAVEDLGSSIGPIERETLNDRVYRELKNSIMAGAFKPGSELTLRSVAEALGTSFMPVRDAMRRLVTERGLEIQPSRTIAIPILRRKKTGTRKDSVVSRRIINESSTAMAI